MLGLSLEVLLTSSRGFGLTTATPVQRAICRIIDGRPLRELAANPDVVAAVGDVSALPDRPPKEVLILGPTRGGKSIITAAHAFRASQICDISSLGDGEVARVSTVSLKIDLARVIYGHLVGNALARPQLAPLVMGDPAADSVMVRHPRGRPVEIKVVAGARAGATLIARWSAGCIFDEAPRMIGQEEGVVNYDDCRSAILSRLLPGAQIISIGSPWAPFGPIYDKVQERQGKPGKDLVVIRTNGPAMNPFWWTPERCEEIKTLDPAAYQTDVLGEFADPESSLFDDSVVDDITREELVLPHEPGHQYVATMDAATRTNAWTLTVGTDRWVGEPGADLLVRTVVLAKDWRPTGGQPLDPEIVMAEIATLLAPYRVKTITSDAWSLDALRAIARRHGLWIADKTMTAPLAKQLYLELRLKAATREIEVPPIRELRADLKCIRKITTSTGIQIHLQKTADGRHADFAPPLALMTGAPLVAPPRPVPKIDEAAEAARAQERLMKQALARSGRQDSRRWLNGSGRFR